MEKPILSLSSKDFLTGLGNGAHIGTGGIFFKADGVTPLFEAGTNQSPNNGLLMAGASATTIGGTPNGNFISSAQYTSTANTKMFFGTSTNHIFSLILNSTLSNSLVDAHTTATALRQGMDRLTDTTGGEWLFYFMNTAIGTFDLNATWNDTWATISGDDVHCSHKYFDQILFGNSGYVGQIIATADLSTSGASNLDKLKLNVITKGNVTDISDDGIYAIIACTKNITCDPYALSGSTILFWDGYSTSWLREYQVPDPYIFALEHTPFGVFAFGTTGIWQVAFGMEPRKVFSRSPGLYSLNTTGALNYGRNATSHYGDALLWGGTSGSNYAIKTFGKLDSGAPNAYFHPFLSTASQNITLVDGQAMKGYVFVGDTTPALKAYPFSTANAPQTGVVAQTIYFPIPEPIDVTNIRVTFGEPLATGDSLTVAALVDEDTAATTFGTIAYDSAKTIRSKMLAPSIQLKAEDSVSIKLTFGGGSPKIKKVELYGTPMDRANK